MGFFFTGRFRVPVAVAYTGHGYQFEYRYLTRESDHLLYSLAAHLAAHFSVNGSPQHAYFELSSDAWIKMDIESVGVVNARIVPAEQANSFRLVWVDPANPEAGFDYMLTWEGGELRLAGFDMIGRRAFILASGVPPWLPEFTRAPLVAGRSHKGRDYSGLRFSRSTLADLNLDEINMRAVTFDSTTFANVSFRGANLASSSFSKVTCDSTCDFTDADLTSAGFGNSELGGAVFDRAVLRNGKLNLSNLQGASLVGADLSDALMFGTNLCGANLEQANLSRINYLRFVKIDRTTRLRGVKLDEADLSGFNFSGWDLTGVSLVGANLKGADFRGAILEGTDFSRTDLTEAFFDEEPRFSTDPNHPTRFCKATLPFSLIKRKWNCLDLTGAHIRDLPQDLSTPEQPLQAMHAILTGLDLSAKTLEHARFDDADLRGTNLTRAILDNASFRGAVLGRYGDEGTAVLYGASLFNVDMTAANLAGADLQHVNLHGARATVANATMPLVKLNGAFLAGMQFDGAAELRGANFTGACLVSCSLRKCNLSPYFGVSSSLAKTCLQGVDFADCQLYSVDLNDAAVAPEPGDLLVKILVHGEPVDLTYAYEPTNLPEAATNPRSTCPSGATGPCVGEKLRSPHAPMKEWVSPARSRLSVR